MADHRTCVECGCHELDACIVRNPGTGETRGCSWARRGPGADQGLCGPCAGLETRVRGPVGAGDHAPGVTAGMNETKGAVA